MTVVVNETTLAELALILGKLGVREQHTTIVPGVEYRARHGRSIAIYRVILDTATFRAIGEGSDLITAYNDAIARVEHRIGEALASDERAR